MGMLAFATSVVMAWALATLLASPPVADRLPAADFFPLAMHNTWTHEVRFSGGDYHYYMTETVIKDNWPLLGHLSYVVAEDYEPLTDRAPEARSTVAYFRKNGFLYRYPWLDSEGDRIWDTRLGQGLDQIMPSPFVERTRWRMDLSTRVMASGGQSSSSATAWIDPSAIQVPAGTFRNCLRVETVTISFVPDPRKKSAEFALRHTEWYARGVGLVKAISSEGTAQKSVTELLRYQIREKEHPTHHD